MIIYKTINLINKKIYIGQHYKDDNDSYLGSGKYLKRAIEKYGKENFVRETLEIIEDNQELLNEREIYWINKLDSRNRYIGYNISVGGVGSGSGKNNYWYSIRGKNHHSFGKKHTEETKNKMRNNHYNCSGKNNPMYGKTGENSHNFGRKHTEETKKKMKDNHYDCSGKNSPNYGKKFSNSTRKKMSDASLGRIPTIESRKKMSNSRKGEKNHRYGKHLTDETKQKLRYANSGKNNPNTTKKEIIEQILKLLDNKYTVTKISEMLNIGKFTIYKVKNTTYFQDLYNL